MSIFAHIFLLVLGVDMVRTIYKREIEKFNWGMTNPYLKLYKTICSEEDFIAKLKVSIFQSFVIRFIFLGLFIAGIYAYTVFALKDVSLRGSLGEFAVLDYLGLWIEGALILMGDRAISAYWGPRNPNKTIVAIFSKLREVIGRS